MLSDFEDLNAYVYHSARGAVYDVVIWCLAPYVHPDRRHGRLRRGLGWATRAAVRRWYRIDR
jgi:hypothetical protein